MNLKQLEYFITAAETLNFTKAAEKCFITQTAMSQQIKCLEESIGIRLFDRDRHHVRLTAAGDVYLREARSIIRHCHDAARLARNTSEGISGNICIGFIRGYAHTGMANIIHDYHSTYPNIKISFYRDNMSGLYAALEDERCDLIFNLAPSIGKSYMAVDRHYIASYALTVALPQGHRYADRKALRYAELEDEAFIVMQPSDRPKDEAEEALVAYERGGFIPNIVAAEGDPETLLLMVSAGIGISVLPEYIIDNHALGQGLRIVPIVKEDGTPEMLDVEICRKLDKINPAAERFFEDLKLKYDRY